MSKTIIRTNLRICILEIQFPPYPARHGDGVLQGESDMALVRWGQPQAVAFAVELLVFPKETIQHEDVPYNHIHSLPTEG